MDWNVEFCMSWWRLRMAKPAHVIQNKSDFFAYSALRQIILGLKYFSVAIRKT